MVLGKGTAHMLGRAWVLASAEVGRAWVQKNFRSAWGRAWVQNFFQGTSEKHFFIYALFYS